MTLSFIEYLETELGERPPKQKGQRTRERLKIAAARMLEQKGYHAMRVSDVTEAAGLAEGSFYVYFKDKFDVTRTVLSALLEDFFSIELVPAEGRSPFASIRWANRRWIAMCRNNAGLMRCVLQVGDEDPEFARLISRTNRVWYERVAEGVLRRFPDEAAERGPALLAAYCLGAMMDDLSRKLIVYNDPEFQALLSELHADDEALADATSVIWMRVLYPGMRIDQKLASAATVLASWA